MKRKVKIWMIWSYLFVLALFLMIYLGIRLRTERNIRELYMEKQFAVMNQTMLAVDEHVEMVMKMCLGIIQEPYVRYFPYVGSDLSRYDAAMKAIGKSNADPKKCEEYQDMVAGILSRETLPEVFPAIKELFVMLCRERRESGGEQELAERVMSYLEEHYWDPAFSLQMCAEHFGMSPEHLSRTIKALTGRKFIDIVNSLRLERAKRYLLETDKKMEEIAELSGYGTAKTFFRSFKQAEGVPPGVWRKQMRDQKEML